MTIAEAIPILRRYQDWRRGYDVRTMDEAGVLPEITGKALDAVLAHFGSAEPLTVCAGCPMARLDDCGDPVACGVEKCIKGKE